MLLCSICSLFYSSHSHSAGLWSWTLIGVLTSAVQVIKPSVGNFISETTSPNTSTCSSIIMWKKTLKILQTMEKILLKCSYKYSKWMNSTSPWSNSYQTESKHKPTDFSGIRSNNIFLTYIISLAKRWLSIFILADRNILYTGASCNTSVKIRGIFSLPNSVFFYKFKKKIK